MGTDAAITNTDHLVVVAHTLAQGAQWCETKLGVAAGAGGQHALMGTHNRLLAIGSAAHPLAYLEIIAIDPDAPAPTRSRWFGMDALALQVAVREEPRLVHVVARTAQLDRLGQALSRLGLEPGVPVEAARDTPQGRLAWRIQLRDDGDFDRDFALPTLIEWQGRHPAESMPASSVRLQSVQAGGMPPAVAALLQWRGLAHMQPATPRWRVIVQTPLGMVALESWNSDRPRGA